MQHQNTTNGISVRHMSAQPTICLFVLLLLCPVSQAKVGTVRLKANVLQWGQYKNVKGVIAVDASSIRPTGDSAESLPNRIKDHPISGASSILYYCQRPGRPFFSPDGKTIIETEKQRLRKVLQAINRFDMLPLIILFDPDPSCRLKSEQAYAVAACTFVREFEKEFWFLLCVSDRCGAAAWRTPGPALDLVRLTRRVARAVHQQSPTQIVAAGSADPMINAKLLEQTTPIGAIVARADQLDAIEGKSRPTIKCPIVEVIEASSAKQELLQNVVRNVLTNPTYGFAVHFQSTPAPERPRSRAAFLDRLAKAVDAYQKTAYQAAPPDQADSASLKPGEAQDGFRSLFNGKDLSGWVQLTKPGNFIVSDGVIQLKKRTGGWLRSWHAYNDFVLRAEYKIQKGGNSGIYIRSPLVGRNSRIGFEFQIRGQPPTAPVSRESSGSIYDARPPDGNFMKPDDWNEVEITCIGTQVKIIWNGRLAHHFQYEDIDFMKNRATRGYIGLQDHHNFVQFRNLRIKPLD